MYILYLCNILYIHYAWCGGGRSATFTGGVCWMSVVWSRSVWGLLTGCDLLQILTKNEKIFYLFGIQLVSQQISFNLNLKVKRLEMKDH